MEGWRSRVCTGAGRRQHNRWKRWNERLPLWRQERIREAAPCTAPFCHCWTVLGVLHDSNLATPPGSPQGQDSSLGHGTDYTDRSQGFPEPTMLSRDTLKDATGKLDKKICAQMPFSSPSLKFPSFSHPNPPSFISKMVRCQEATRIAFSAASKQNCQMESEQQKSSKLKKQTQGRGYPSICGLLGSSSWKLVTWVFGLHSS